MSFLTVVKSELKKNAVGVVLKGFNARITSKYRHMDPPRDMIGNDDSESSGLPTPVQRTPTATLKRPPRPRTTSDVPIRTRVLSTGRLNTSPESSRPPSSFNMTMTSASSTQDSRSQRGRSGTGKILNFFRHKKRLSADSSMSAYSGTMSGRQSLDGRVDGLQEPDPEPTIARSKSSVRQ